VGHPVEVSHQSLAQFRPATWQPWSSKLPVMAGPIKWMSPWITIRAKNSHFIGKPPLAVGMSSRSRDRRPPFPQRNREH